MRGAAFELWTRQSFVLCDVNRRVAGSRMQAYTEAQNAKTENIDISSTREIVAQLGRCDMEMFAPDGLEESAKTLGSNFILSSVVELSNRVRNVLNSDNKMVVMTGCGTSGRIAFMISRTFQRHFGVGFEKIAYAIAGGDIALFTSQEAPEDDNKAGVRDLLKVCNGKQHILLIGITCGLSAPYVAGQLDHGMNNLDKFTPVLLGFNPVNLARNVSIQGWDKTFLDVATKLESLTNQEKTLLINPVLAGEAITGSSRMKGGSVTKILLEVVFIMAAIDQKWTTETCKDIINCYLSACRQLYGSNSESVSKLISAAGESLKHEGHIYQVGSGGIAVLGIIDATECPPTYGATLEDIRGFILNGYNEYGNVEGGLSHVGEAFRIDSGHLVELLQRNDSIVKDTVLIMATAQDPILFELAEEKELGKQLSTISHKPSNRADIFVVLILEHNEDPPLLPTYLRNVFTVYLRTSSLLPKTVASMLTPKTNQLLLRCVKEICAKWIFNAVSTGAHIMKGKVFKNCMVDLKVSNQKLFHRSVGIVMRFCDRLTEDEARHYLLRSIYRRDDLEAKILNDPISSHILVATPQDRVVPTAIVMAIKDCTYVDATLALQQFHVIRDALSSLLQNSM